MIVDSAFLLLLSFVLAGLLHLFLHAGNIGRFISGSKRLQVLKTALIGIPLPLCSCSVLPVAYQLRKAGVSKGGTSSFLISTPESGVDSILLTYSLMDPMMTVARPVAAFATALAAGNLEASFPDNDDAAASDTAGEVGCQTDDSCCASEKSEERPAKKQPVSTRVCGGIKYGFTDLFNDLAVYLLAGYVVAGLVVALFGGELLNLPAVLTDGWGGYVGAIVVGVPLYICATSSTPLAAALLLTGFSPGAVLVFLLVGPATNVASLAVVSKILNGWGMVRYLLAIIVVAVVSGIVVDWLYAALSLPVSFRAGESHTASWYHVVAGILFLVLLVRALGRKAYRRLRGVGSTEPSPVG